jgi:GAF domain-containing protein
MSVATEIIPADESKRIAAVRRYEILDTPPDGTFDRITALASELFDVPIALVTIVDEDRIWFKSRSGLDDVNQIPRDPGLCASAILQDTPYIVEEARRDPRTLANPLVCGQFGLQFYAAAPLRTVDGYRLGTLCIIDREPRVFSPKQADVLDRLSQIVMDEMELRLNAIRAVAQARVAEPLTAGE